MFDHIDDDDRRDALAVFVSRMNKALAPNYRITFEGDLGEIDPHHLAAAFSIETQNGHEGSEEEVQELMNRLMKDLNDGSFGFEDANIGKDEFREDDLSDMFKGQIVQETPEEPEIEAFIDRLFSLHILGVNVLGHTFAEVTVLMRENGIDHDLAMKIMSAFASAIDEGSDLHAYQTHLFAEWDENHPDGPSSTVLNSRAFAKISDGPPTDEQAGEVMAETLHAMYAEKHKWRYHMIGLIDLDQQLFEAIWNDPDPLGGGGE